MWSASLLHQVCQIGSILRIEEVATPGKPPTDTHRMFRHFVAAHGAIAFFDPPANRTLTGIVGAIERFALGSFPLAMLGRPLARCTKCPVPSAPHQTVHAPFDAYSFPFVHSDVLRRVGCPVWIA